MNHLRCEKLTFNNPTEDFRRKLLKAGGVSGTLTESFSIKKKNNIASVLRSVIIFQER